MSDSLKDIFDIDDDEVSTPSTTKSEIDAFKETIDFAKNILTTYKSIEDVSTVNKEKQDSLGFDNIVVEMSKLLNTANKILENNSYALLTDHMVDPELVSSTSLLISNTRDILNDFISLFKEKIRYMKAIELENLKTENKMKVNEHKLRLTYELSRGINSFEDADVVNYTQEQIVATLLKNSNAI